MSEAGKFRVAIDAMGGDFAPKEPVGGAVLVAREYGYHVLLVGDRSAVEAELSQLDADGLDITVVPSQGSIEETDNPVRAIREKPNASILAATKLVKTGEAQAVVSMGSTGASMASATLVLGLLQGIDRPAIGGPLFGKLSQTLLMDLGSNVDCRPSQLLGFGALGVAFARTMQGVQTPRVGLLSVGAEEGKGNRQTKEAYPLFKESGLNFVGNVEGMDLFLDKVDVVVCDGFVGNVLMKYAEGLGMALRRYLPEALGHWLPSQALEGISGELAAITAPADVGGGGPLFGVDGTVIVGHGRASAGSIAEAAKLAERIVGAGLVDAMRHELAALDISDKAPK